MNTETFLVADPHFCHSKAVEFRKDMGWADWREMNAELVYRWNQTVRPCDNVILLGDVALCSGDEEKLSALDALMQSLQGNKFHLVMGNHDRDDIVGGYMDRLSGSYERKGYILTHIPVHRSQAKRFRGNFHGHLHGQQVTETEIVYDRDPQDLEVDYTTFECIDPFYLCLSVEHTDYAPISWTEAVTRFKEQQ